jgi:hypothetical protein
MDKKQPLSSIPFLVMIGLGSEGIQVVMKFLKVAERYGVDLVHGAGIWLILIDDHFNPPRDMGTSPLRSYDVPALHATFVPVALVDKESRENLHAAGRLWMLDRQAIENPGVRLESAGAGGQPVWGKALTRMNELVIAHRVDQGLHTYSDNERSRDEAEKGAGPARRSILDFVVTTSPAGGCGGGALPDVLRIVKERAAHMQVPVKTHLELLDLGTIYPANRAMAIENRRLLLNYLRVVKTGQYRDLEGVGDVNGMPLYDSAAFSPNAGAYSQLSTLEAHEWHLAHQIFFKFCSPMSPRLRESSVDAESKCDRDDSGAACSGIARGIWAMTLPRPTYRRYCANRGVSAFVDTVRNSTAPDAALQARQAASEMNLVESYSESHTVRRLTQANGTDPDMFQEGRETFRDRIAGLSGVQALQAIIASCDWVLRELIPQVQQPRIVQRTGEIIEGLGTRIAGEKAGCAHDLAGLIRMRRWLEEIHGCVQESGRINAEKLAALSQFAEGVLMEFDAGRRRVDSYVRMGFFGRFVHYFPIQAAVRRLKGLAERIITLETERTARTAVHEQVLLPADERLMRELADILLLEGKLEGIASESARVVEAALKARPSPDEVPVGISLGDGVSLKRFYAEVAEKKGGEVGLVGQMASALIQGQVSLFALLEQPKEQLARTLLRTAGDLFEAEIAAMNVLEVFRARHGHAATSIFSQAALDSRPWIRATGEAGRELSTAKWAGIPEGCDEKWILDHLKRVDHSEGEWRVIKLPKSYDAAILLQHRAGVSLTMLIRQQALSTGKSEIESRVRRAADPLVVIIPDGRLTETDARVVACYAYASGLLTRSPSDGWCLKAANGSSLPIGGTPSALFAFFRKDFDEVVHVYSVLRDNLRSHGAAFRQSLLKLEREWRQDDNLRDLFSDEALWRVLTETRLLLPFVEALAAEEAIS